MCHVLKNIGLAHIELLQWVYSAKNIVLQQIVAHSLGVALPTPLKEPFHARKSTKTVLPLLYHALEKREKV